MIFEALGLSLMASGIAMIGVSILGIALGWCFARYHFRGKFVWNTALLLPLILPPTVTGYYLIQIFGPLFDWRGLILASGVVAFPLMFQSARSAFEKVPLNLEEAAASMGKSPWQCFIYVTLPLARQGLAAGFVLAFARALGEFGATLMIAGNISGKTQTLPLMIYDALISGMETRARTGALVLTGISLGIIALVYWFQRSEGSHSN